MPKFHYSAVSIKGEKISGEHMAASRDGVVEMLRQNGYYPSEISIIDRRTGKSQIKVPIKLLASLCKNMATMLRTGVPIGKTLEILKDQMDNKPLKKLLTEIDGSIQKGMSMSEAFGEYSDSFPPLLMNMVEAGEASGSLDDCLDRAGSYFMHISKLNTKVKNAMIYPSIILMVLIVLLLILLIFVIPTVTQMYTDTGADLPVFTKMIMNASNFLVGSWFLVLGVVVFVITLFNVWISSDWGKGFVDRMKLKTPVINKLIMKIYAARFARTLSSLGASGVPLTQALIVASRSIMNRHIEKALQHDVVDAINRGVQLSVQLEKINLMPPMIVYLVHLGEESGTLDTLLAQAADFYDEESDAAITALTAMMEPMLIILMALIVVPILFGALAPIFGMVEVMM